MRLVNDHDSIEKIVVDFEEDKKFISEVVYFITDIGWVKQDPNGDILSLTNYHWYDILE
ncbi:MAG: hypothetical protein WA941_09105 [Nitrososphaeraceae archaeon]